MIHKTLAALALIPLLTTIGCDAEDDPMFDDIMLDDVDIEMRPAAIPVPIFQPYHGRWMGPMEHVSGNAQLEYDATITMAPGLCTITGSDIYRAQWDYYNLGVTCTSELDLLGVGLAPDGTRTWTFFDTNLSGPCTDGLVDLTETNDPTVMEHTWRTVNGVLDAEGTVTRVALCGGGGGGGGGN